MDPNQAAKLQAIQGMAAQDPEFVKLQQVIEFKAAVHEHTSRCWEKCNIKNEAFNSSLSGGAKTCLDNCVINFFKAQQAAAEFMEKKTQQS
jgi:hypothetical protein